MTKLINKDKLNFYTTNLWNKITEKFVSKTLPNTITGETILSDGFVNGASDITRRHNETRINMVALGTDTGYFGIPSLSIPARTHVDKIICIMHDNAGDIGATVTGLNVGVVSKTTGRLLEYIHRGDTTNVITNPISSGNNSLTGNKAISITINRAWNEEIYFIIGARNLLVGYINSNIPSVGGNDLKDIGYNLGNGTPSNYVGRIAIYTSKYSLNQLAIKTFNSESDLTTLKNDYVSKTGENQLTGKTTLLNGCILNSTISVINNSNVSNWITNDTAWCGTPALSSPANTFISFLCVAVQDGIEIGTEIRNIKVAAVNRTNNRVEEILTTSQTTATVVQNLYGNISSGKVILFPIQKSFDYSAYFVIGFNGMKWGSRSNGAWGTVYPQGSFPTVGRTLTINASNWIPQACLLAEETNLNSIMTMVHEAGVSKAGVSDSNIFTGINSFEGIVNLNQGANIKYRHTVEQSFMSGDTSKNSEWAVYFDREVFIPSGSYVSTLDIRVSNNLSAGNRIDNLYIYEVHKGATINNDAIVSVVTNGSGATVMDKGEYGKVIQTTFNRTFANDTYFIIGQKNGSQLFVANDNMGSIRRTIINGPFILNQSTNIANKSAPSNDKLVHRYNIEEVRDLQADILELKEDTIKIDDIGNTANKIPRLDSNGKIPVNLIPTTSSRMIGELKQLAYDAEETIEENGHTWLKANGQAISKAEYPALFEKMNISRNSDLEEIILPRADHRNGYCYICAK